VGGRAFPLAAGGRRLLQRTPVSGWRRWVWSAATVVALVWLQAELLPVVPRIDADFPDAGAIADRDILAPVPFSAPMLAQDIEMRQMQAMMAEPPVLRRLGNPRRGALDRLASWRDAIVRRAGQTELSLEQRADLVGLLFPELAAQDAARALAMPDPDGFFAAAEAALRRVLDDGVVDVLPPGTYRQVRIVAAGGRSPTPRADRAGRRGGRFNSLSAAGLGRNRPPGCRCARWCPTSSAATDTRAHRLAAAGPCPSSRSFRAGGAWSRRACGDRTGRARPRRPQAHLTAGRTGRQVAVLAPGRALGAGAGAAAVRLDRLPASCCREPQRLVTATLLLGWCCSPAPPAWRPVLGRSRCRSRCSACWPRCCSATAWAAR
jgi:hypothetical protein